MLFTCLPLDNLPPVPDHFVERALKIARAGGENLCAPLMVQYGFLSRDITLADGTVSKSRHTESYDMGADWEEWVKENIISEYMETGVRTSLGYDSPIHGAHVDTYAKYKFFYLIEEGGDNVITTWYIEKGQPAIRYSTPTNIVQSTDYRNLFPIDPVHLPVGKWVLFNTQVLHGVENIVESHRTMLSVVVDVDKISFDIGVKK